MVIFYGSNKPVSTDSNRQLNSELCKVEKGIFPRCVLFKISAANPDKTDLKAMPILKIPEK